MEQLFRQICAKVNGYVNAFSPMHVVPCFCVFFILLLLLNKNKWKSMQLGFMACWALYLTSVLEITLLGRTDGNVNTMQTFFVSYIQLWKHKYEIIYDMVFNVFLFLPMGILFSKFGGRKKISILIFIISLFIESAQFLTGRGILELSDLVNNTLGGIIGISIKHVISDAKEKYQGNIINKEKM